MHRIALRLLSDAAPHATGRRVRCAGGRRASAMQRAMLTALLVVCFIGPAHSQGVQTGTNQGGSVKDRPRFNQARFDQAMGGIQGQKTMPEGPLDADPSAKKKAKQERCAKLPQPPLRDAPNQKNPLFPRRLSRRSQPPRPPAMAGIPSTRTMASAQKRTAVEKKAARVNVTRVTRLTGGAGRANLPGANLASGQTSQAAAPAKSKQAKSKSKKDKTPKSKKSKSKSKSKEGEKGKKQKKEKKEKKEKKKIAKARPKTSPNPHPHPHPHPHPQPHPHPNPNPNPNANLNPSPSQATTGSAATRCWSARSSAGWWATSSPPGTRGYGGDRAQICGRYAGDVGEMPGWWATGSPPGTRSSAG